MAIAAALTLFDNQLRPFFESGEPLSQPRGHSGVALTALRRH